MDYIEMGWTEVKGRAGHGKVRMRGGVEFKLGGMRWDEMV